jgi:hypothetical protein
MRLTLFFTIEFLLALLVQVPPKVLPNNGSSQQLVLKCSDECYWYKDRKFFFKVKNSLDQTTTIVFDTANINKGYNAEFVRYYFYKDIHLGCLICFSINTDTVFDGQVTNKFTLKIDSFYMNPTMEEKL